MAVRPDAATSAAAPPAGWRARRGPGWTVVAGKELAEGLTSLRFLVLFGILVLAAASPVYAASGVIRELAEAASEAAAVFLALFTIDAEPVPAFVPLVGFLAPLLGIAFGFDAINGERAQGTLPRLLSQPIHRDDVINGKFAAGLAMIAIAVTAVMLIVAGIGLLRLGIAPSPAEVGRLVAWWAVTIVYIGLWLAFATLCSVIVRRAATSALLALGVWLALSMFAVMLAQMVAGLFNPANELARAQLVQGLSAVNPGTLYGQVTLALLNPSATTVTVPNVAEVLQLRSQIPTQLSLDQSLLVAWPQIVILVALTVACFVAAYVAFLRQEVRA